MKITAVWIVKNEAANLRRSIESLRAVTDELVVVDTGSADDTVAVAGEYGARVEHFTWVNDFAAARNYALSLVRDADLLFFLDADEWFQPAFQPGDRSFFEEIRQQEDWDVGGVVEHHLDMDTGVELNTSYTARLYRGDRPAEYVSPIHEYPRLLDGRTRLVRKIFIELNLNHSGYGGAVDREKSLRNIEILKKCVDDPSLPDTAVYQYYILRESLSLNAAEDILASLQWLLDHPKATRGLMSSFTEAAANLMVLGIQQARHPALLLSQRQVYQNLLRPFMETFPKHPLVPLLDLEFALLVEGDESKLPDTVEAQVQKAKTYEEEANFAYGMTYIDGAISTLYARAARTALRWGRPEQAFDFASSSLRTNEGTLTDMALQVLLRCIRGLPDADVIQFLNSILTTKKRGTLRSLLQALRTVDGFQILYAYFIKKAMDQKWVDDGDLFYLFIVQGEYEKAAHMAWQRLEQRPELSRNMVFLACVCGGEALYGPYRGQLEGYDAVLEAFYAGTPVTGLQKDILLTNYERVAFAAGVEIANRLHDLFLDALWEAFMAKGSYYLNAGAAALFLEDNLYPPAYQDMAARHLLAELQLEAGRYDDAFETLDILVKGRHTDSETFALLDAVARRAEGEEAGSKARALYDEIFPAWQEARHILDVARTGWVGAEDSKKERRQLSALTADGFSAMKEKEAARLYYGDPAVLLKAGEVYAEKRAYTRAVSCYARLLATGYEAPTVSGRLAGIFEKLNNPQLAASLRRQAGP